MNALNLLNLGLGSLPLLSDAETRSISAENPTGEKGGGAKAVPDKESAASTLGLGWKVRPCITLEPGTTTMLANVQGPGIIQHIWITVNLDAYRDTVLRFYWDAEEMPSVEVPLGDFFCNGHGLRYNVNSLPVAVNPSGGFNCYWPMPFRQRARITVENQQWEPIDGFFYQITYALTEVPENSAYFHAQWRRSMTTREYPEHVILEGVQGQTIPPSAAPVRRTTSAARGASAGKPTPRSSWAIPSTTRSRVKCLATVSTAGTCWTPFASSRT
jgi:hypothetical protein